jgi:hypothetical protein
MGSINQRKKQANRQLAVALIDLQTEEILARPVSIMLLTDHEVLFGQPIHAVLLADANGSFMGVFLGRLDTDTNAPND